MSVIKITHTLDNHTIWCITDIFNIHVDNNDEYDYKLYLKFLETKRIKDYITEHGPFKGIEHNFYQIPLPIQVIINNLIDKYNIQFKHCENLVKLKCGEHIIDPKKFTNMCYNIFDIYNSKIKELEQKINAI
jgi:hypothetical protein